MINNVKHRKDSNEVPVTPPTTLMRRKVNDADSAYLTAKENLHSLLELQLFPTAALPFAVLDKLPVSNL